MKNVDIVIGMKERLENSILLGSPDGCWYWLGTKDQFGYGKIYGNGKYQRAHRVSYAIYKGQPGQLLVCHYCDNRLCVNPNHLFLGTYQDNSTDYTNKFSKIPENELPKIKELYAGGMNQTQIAALYKVDQSYISYIVNNKCRLKQGKVPKEFVCSKSPIVHRKKPKESKNQRYLIREVRKKLKLIFGD